jgi:septal ring factor EnvC (AmiA/AmiB activator)
VSFPLVSSVFSGLFDDLKVFESQVLEHEKRENSVNKVLNDLTAKKNSLEKKINELKNGLKKFKEIFFRFLKNCELFFKT